VIELLPLVVSSWGTGKDSVRVRVRIRVRVRVRVRVDLGYISKNARTVAKGLSAPLLVHVMRPAISFSHSLLFLFAKRPLVTSRYFPIVRVRDS
jgi:hypothetical protein